ncbi:SDR family oxidoreductase [Microcoleus sp. K1-B6]|uniref:SDR family oxidoreductase n=1 Tax=unclassified Microcoleus TaxID=2642155 RepID=UPI002FD438FC
MTEKSHIFLAGASRGVGLEIAKLLVEQKMQVTALLRSPATSTELEAMGIKVVNGDALDAAAMEAAMAGGDSIHAVISTIGSLPKDREISDYWGNKNLIDAAVKAGVQKFILVSSIGSGNSVGALPPQALETLRPVLIEKEKAENHLIASGMIYTVIRPGGLKSEPATGNGILTEDCRVSGTIHRADVAQLVCQCLVSDAANNKVVSAVDKQMVYGHSEFEVLTF